MKDKQSQQNQNVSLPCQVIHGIETKKETTVPSTRVISKKKLIVLREQA